MTTQTEITMDRRTESDRRSGEQRRQEEVTVASERREGDRRTVQRRRHIDPTTCERDYSTDEIEFMPRSAKRSRVRTDRSGNRVRGIQCRGHPGDQS